MEFETPLRILSSQAAQEILEHMSHEERRRLLDEIHEASAVRLRCLKRVVMALIPVTGAAVLLRPWAGFAVFIAAIVSFWIWQDRHFRRVRGSIADRLCASAYARSRGFQQEQLI